MSTNEDNVSLRKRFRFLRGALGLTSGLLLASAFVTFFAPMMSGKTLVTSLTYLLVALVIIFAIALQKTSREIMASLVAKDEAAEEESPAPFVFVPKGPEYAKARKTATLFQVVAVALLAGSLIGIPAIGNIIISSGASFTVFNVFMIVTGVVLLSAAIASKYFTSQARKIGLKSIQEQEAALRA